MMPTIDMSEVIDDPDLTESVTLLRRVETLGANGRNTITETSYTIGAVVTPGTQPGFIRTPDGQAMPNTITVHTSTILQGPAAGLQPDIIQWNGMNYVVRIIYDFSNFGAGFTSAQCEAISLVGQPVGTP